MVLSNIERERVKDLYDVYDLVELLNLSSVDIIDAFDYLIEENEEIMERVSELQVGELEAE